MKAKDVLKKDVLVTHCIDPDAVISVSDGGFSEAVKLRRVRIQDAAGNHLGQTWEDYLLIPLDTDND